MESGDHVENYKPPTFPNPFIFFSNLLSLQAEILSTTVLNLVSPLFSLISLLSGLFFHKPYEEPKHEDSEETLVPNATRGGSLLLGRIAIGLLAAAYVCMVLIIVMVVAAVLGVGLVKTWAEEPVYARENLQFDYTDSHPTAVFYFGDKVSVPAGHTIYVSLVLLMPESDYNRDIGIFQLTAELLSAGGELIAKSSHPCMLQFVSWPVRLTRTSLMAVPLLLGITTETQRITFPILKHKEAGYPWTEEVRITLIPRAGTLSLPQFYDAEVLMRSRPPWMKEFVYQWKWTFYVWTTLDIFVVLVMILVFFLKPLIFPIMVTPFEKFEQDSVVEEAAREPLVRTREGREVSESLRRWQRSRGKRKAALLHGEIPESVDSSACSMSLSQGESVNFEEDSGDSESVCFRGLN